jgi:hypothetical protein
VLFRSKYCWVRLKLNICLRIGVKILEQTFMMKPGLSSSPRDIEGFVLLMALQTSASEMRERDKIQKIARDGESPQSSGYYKQIESA